MATESLIDKMLSQFTSIDQIKVFCESQYKEILKLTKKIKTLEEANDKLLLDLDKEKAKFAVASQNGDAASVDNVLINLDEADHELICKLQLAILRNRAMQMELTLEEARKVEIYSKVLQQDTRKEKKSNIVKQLSNDDLVKMLEGNADDSEKAY